VDAIAVDLSPHFPTNLHFEGDLLLSSESQLTGGDLSAAAAHSRAHVVAGYQKRPSFPIDASDQDVDVRMQGVVVVNGDPLEAPSEVVLYAMNELSGMSSKVQLLTELRRHDQLPEPRILLSFPGAESLLQLHLVALAVKPEAALVSVLHALAREVAPVPVPGALLCVSGVGHLDDGALKGSSRCMREATAATGQPTSCAPAPSPIAA
jgi:hypothetical protein